MKVNENITLTEAVYYILLSLTEPMHGYGIMQNVTKLSNNRVNLAAGTLYGALTTMQERSWIEAVPSSDESNSRRKEYKITPTGEAIVKKELVRLRELVNNGEHILEPALVGSNAEFACDFSRIEERMTQRTEGAQGMSDEDRRKKCAEKRRFSLSKQVLRGDI